MKLFDVIVRRVHAQVPVVNVKLQDSIMHERPHLRSYIDTVVAGTVLRCYKLAALPCRRAREKKHERKTIKD